MDIRQVVVLVQPMVPMPHRLPPEVACARLLLASLDGGLALLVVLHVRQHGREQHERGRRPGEPEHVDTEWLVGELLRLAACGRQDPHLHPLLGLLVGLDFIRLPVRQEAERAIVAEAG